MRTNLSVIICTYNPQEAILKRCLDAITVAASVSPFDELVIVDNNSSFDLKEESYIRDFLQRHSAARIVTEKQQGLTPARLRGIKEAKGDVVVFIDDDNFIDPQFFKAGKSVAENNPHIGAWSGQVKLVFEVQPEEWTRRYWGLLVHREFESDKWSNIPHLTDTMPCGAGLFARRTVADHYVWLHDNGKRFIQLDRTGKSLFSGGDNDLAACACDVGLGVGLFHEIIVNHFIPADRLSKAYLLRLAEGISASSIVFRALRNDLPSKRTMKNRVADLLRLMLKKGVHREFYKAVLNGEKAGRELIEQSRLQRSSL